MKCTCKKEKKIGKGADNKVTIAVLVKVSGVWLFSNIWIILH